MLDGPVTPEEAEELAPTRVLSLSRGAAVCLTVAVLLWVAAGFLLFMGIEKVSDTGFPFLCGTALDRPDTDLAVAGCGYLNRNQLLLATWVAASGLVVAAGGLLTFGVRLRPHDGAPASRPQA